jgi:hypothetical protein
MKIFILFSADYELFLGQNFLPEKEVLIDPTEKLLSGCQEDGIPVTLFADVASVWRYRSLQIKSDYPRLFDEQLIKAINTIHDVQLHIHPHWLTSDCFDNEWVMDTSKFKLCDVGFKDKQNNHKFCAEDLLADGKSYLENLLQKEKANYRCLAFRAGGYGIQPEDQKLFKALLSEGFIIDSSVTPDLIYKSNVNKIDFSELPKKMNCRFGPVHGLSKEVEHGIFEIPVAGFNESFSETMKRRLNNLTSEITHINRRFLRHYYGEHKPRGRGIQNDNILIRLARQFINPSHFELELSGFPVDVDRMICGTVKFIDLHRHDSDKLFFSALCHPKELFPSSIISIREYWERIKTIYHNNIKAITFQEAGELISTEKV